MTDGLVVIALVLAIVAGAVYLLWRLGPGLEQEKRAPATAESTTLPIYRRFEQPWRWAMLISYFGLLMWATAARLHFVTFSRWGLLAVAAPFASMALFGLYTGEITFRESTVRREQSPIRFWLYFGLDVLLAGLFVYLVAMGKVQ